MTKAINWTMTVGGGILLSLLLNNSYDSKAKLSEHGVLLATMAASLQAVREEVKQVDNRLRIVEIKVGGR